MGMSSRIFENLGWQISEKNDERKKQMKIIMNIVYLAIALFAFACFALSPTARAVDPPEMPAAFSVELVGTFDYPGSGNSTQPQKISDLGDIVGWYVDSSLVQRGFIRFRNGNFSAPLVDPNDTGDVTQGRGINNSRLVCG